MTAVTVATWNVNSLRARLEPTLAWVDQHRPDVLLLQELKLERALFPDEAFSERGYNFLVAGQKTYNGVAVLARAPLTPVEQTLPNAPNDEARYAEAVIEFGSHVARCASVYLPNGQEVGSDKFAHKLAFYAALAKHAATLQSYEEICILGGDYNVAPAAIDIYDAEKLSNEILYSLPERQALRRLLHGGWHDAFRLANPTAVEFSWWDYRAGMWPKNQGARIDHLLLSPRAADAMESCVIDRTPRAADKPSDHAPVMATFKLISA